MSKRVPAEPIPPCNGTRFGLFFRFPGCSYLNCAANFCIIKLPQAWKNPRNRNKRRLLPWTAGKSGNVGNLAALLEALPDLRCGGQLRKAESVS